MQAAEACAPGKHDPIFLPWLSGERMPVDDDIAGVTVNPVFASTNASGASTSRPPRIVATAAVTGAIRADNHQRLPDANLPLAGGPSHSAECLRALALHGTATDHA